MSSAPLSWPPSVPRPTTRPRSNTVASCDGPPVSGSVRPSSDAPAPTPLPLSWPITLLLWAAGASAPRSASRPLLHANACWTYPSQKGAQNCTGRSGSGVVVSAVPSTVPLLVIAPGRPTKLPGPPNVPGSTSLYGYCVRACAGPAKVSAGRIAAAISAARRLLMVVALSRWCVGGDGAQEALAWDAGPAAAWMAPGMGDLALCCGRHQQNLPAVRVTRARTGRCG